MNVVFFFTAPLGLLKEMCSRSHLYSESIPLRVSVGTYNVNGGKHFRSLAYNLSLDDWLLDSQQNEGKNRNFQLPFFLLLLLTSMDDLNIYVYAFLLLK